MTGAWPAIALAAGLVGLAGGAWLGRRTAARRSAAVAARALRAQKMEAVARLASGLAHDINNHLATIRTHAELLARRSTPEATEAGARAIVAATLRASSLLERLLAFAQRQRATPEPLDVGAAVRELEPVLRASLPDTTRLETTIHEPAGRVRLDLGELEQVLTNLVLNARDALPAGRPGRISIDVAASGSRDGGTLLVSVSDDGQGIPAGDLERIFEPFFTTKGARGGSGLGLASVDAIVRAAGGHIEAESEPGRGATFRIALPLDTGAWLPARVRRGGGAEILLAEDDGDLGRAIEDLLSNLDYRVTRVDSMAAAMAVGATGRRFAALVSDVRLRDGTGPELFERLREAGRTERALYLSGFTDRIALRPPGASSEAFFVKKPFSAEGLARMLGDLLAGPV